MELKNILLSLPVIAISAVFLYAAPVKSSGTYEITVENMDSGGSPVDGYTNGTTSLISAIAEPGGITRLSGGNYVLQSGYLGQDLIPPRKVIDLGATVDPRTGKITLTWSSPGDDYNSEQLFPGSKFFIATTTVLSDALNDGYWYARRNSNSCEIVITTGSLNPDSPSRDSMTAGLIEGVTYYFRLWTLDQAANWSEISSGTSSYFLFSPGAITDIAASPGMYGKTIRLTWSAPGDDGYKGTLPPGSVYAIQRSTWAGVSYSTYSADTVFISTSSVVPGEYQSYNIPSLQQGSTYYVRMWTADENVSWSDMSNAANAWATWVKLSLTLDTTWFSFGTLATGISTDTYKSTVVTNNGNVFQTYSLRGMDSETFGMRVNPGPDIYKMELAFHDSRPNLADYNLQNNILSLTDGVASPTRFAIDDIYTGSDVDPFPSVPSQAQRKLWLKLSTPLSTSTTIYQQPHITITAQDANP